MVKKIVYKDMFFWLFQKHSFQGSFENGKMGALTKMGF